MKRLVSVIILLLAFSSFYPTTAQSLEEQLRLAESFKSQYGETDSRYLDALSQAVSIAVNDGKVDTAIATRQLHSEITKRVYGEVSFEFAEDLWRLGNIRAEIKSSDSIEYYEKVVSILKNLKQEKTYLYSDTQRRLFWAYREKKDWDSALKAMNHFTETAPFCVNIEWNGRMIEPIDIAHGYHMIGVTYSSAFNDYESALVAFKKCLTILEENDLLENYVYSITTLSQLSHIYFFLKDYVNSLNWGLRCVELTEQLKKTDSDEFINELILLRGCYYFLEDSENELLTQERVISLILDRDREKGVDVAFDSKYLKELDYLSRAYSLAGRSKDERMLLYKLLDIYEKRGESISEACLGYLYSLVLSYHLEGDYSAEYQLFEKYDEIAKRLGKNENEEFYYYLSNKMTVLTSLYKEDEYKEAQSQLQELADKLYGPNSFQRLTVEVDAIRHLLSLDSIADAQTRLNNCYKLLESGQITFAEEKDSLAIWGDLIFSEGQVLTLSNPFLAENKYLKSKEYYSQLGLPLCEPLNNLGLLYFSYFRDSRKALDYFLNAKEELGHGDHNNPVLFITILNNIAACYQDLGMSSDAIVVFDEAAELVKKFYGISHPMYGMIALNKSKFYAELSDYDKAIEYAIEAASCIKQVYGEQSEKYAICLNNLSILYGANGNIDESKDLILKAIPVLEKTNVSFALSSYCCLLSHYSLHAEWDDFYALVNKCSSLIIENQLQNTDIEAILMEEIGTDLQEKDNAEARLYLSKAIQMREKLGRTSSAGYLRALLEYYRLVVSDKLHDKQIIPSLTDAYKELYFTNTIFFNAAEREQFVSSPTYSRIKDIVFTARSDESQDALLYDYLLFSKGLLLETSIYFAKSILNSKNDELIEDYSRLIFLRKKLNGAMAINEGDSLEELHNQATGLERRITAFLKENGGYNEGLNFTFYNVSSALNNYEAAIEFVSYHDYSEETDYYAALVARKGWANPEFVRICKKSELEKYVSVSPSALYGESSASEEAYSLIWGPIIPLLSGIKTVYFSPAGYLNRLAIEQLYNGENRFAEMIQAFRVTSTRQICSPASRKKYSMAVLYGGLDYDEDDTTMISESQSVRGELSSRPVVFRGWDDTITRKGWEYLPGTLEEVNQISSIISKQSINCDVYTSGKGNEESFKALSGGSFDILHVATHGFYMTESQTEDIRFYTHNPYTSTYISNEVSPLKRSGLLMAGGNKAWKGEPIPDGVEDGVLTADEIASLDLSSCDVVVLSACETGLGEITDEGVYGLQRAFKNAGAKSIIMSLWEVDDKATSLMMQSFYINLSKGMDKRDAFDSAQKEVRKKYTDPRYWSAFIMLD